MLAGCPKKSEVVQGPPPAAGPVTTAPPAPLPGTPQPAAPEGPGRLPPEVQVTPRPGIEVQPVPQPRAGSTPEQATETSPLKDIFYDYDAATIRDDQKAAIAADVAWLQAHPGTRVMIEGHCDERGSDEYNLALGERRAQGVKEYLVAAGISAGRLSTVSYGKERPFVLGHDERDWRWNRRAHFVLQDR